MRARTVVIPAGGRGTRFLPATKAVPKELFPVLEMPALQLVIDEAVAAGIDHVVVVSNASKPAIGHYFHPDDDVFASLEGQGRGALADTLRRYENDIRVTIVDQASPLGLGHAVSCAREAVNGEPFVVMLPDELMSAPTLLTSMLDVAEQTGGGVVGVLRVPMDEVSNYGVVTPGARLAHGVVAVRDVVEKPAAKDAPSDLILIGRYVLMPDVFDVLDRVDPAVNGEIQLTDALRVQAATGPFHAVLAEVDRYDTGNPFGWVQAVVDTALAHPDHGPRLRSWLESRLNR